MECESCHERIAMVTVEFEEDGMKFRVCNGCLAEDDNREEPRWRVVKVTGHPAGSGLN